MHDDDQHQDRTAEDRFEAAMRASDFEQARAVADDVEGIGLPILAGDLRDLVTEAEEAQALREGLGQLERLGVIERVTGDQADEQPTTIPDDVYDRACDDVLAVLAERFGGGSIGDDVRLARCLDVGITTAYVLGLRDAYRQAAEKAAEMQREGDPLAALIRLGEDFATVAELDEQRAARGES